MIVGHRLPSCKCIPLLSTVDGGDRTANRALESQKDTNNSRCEAEGISLFPLPLCLPDETQQRQFMSIHCLMERITKYIQYQRAHV